MTMPISASIQISNFEFSSTITSKEEAKKFYDISLELLVYLISVFEEVEER